MVGIPGNSKDPFHGRHSIYGIVLIWIVWAPFGWTQREELVSSRLIIRYDPPVSVAVRENHETTVELLIQLNFSGLLTTAEETDTTRRQLGPPDHIPLWIRCPGKITAVPQPGHLLDILNNSLDVVPMDFITDISTTLVLQGRRLGHVKLTLYWELTNDSMCTTLSEEDEDIVRKEVAVMVFNKSQETSPASNVTSKLAAASSVLRGQRKWDSETSRNQTKVILNKTFVVVRKMKKTQPVTLKPLLSTLQQGVPGLQEGSGVYERHRRSVIINGVLDLNSSTDGVEGAGVDVGSKVVSIERIVIATDYSVHILREENVLDIFVVHAMTLLTVLNMFVIGFRVGPLKELMAVLRKPVAPGIGLVCQYIIMPLISYGFAYACLRHKPYAQLGLFALGCSPGAALSSAWTLILGGDVTVSVAITVTSTLCALFMMPLWLYTLGGTIVLPGVATVCVPYLHLLASLAVVTVPVAISMLIAHYLPSTVKVARRIDCTLSAIVILMINSLAVVTCITTFATINGVVACLGMALACFVYAIGAGLARVFRLDAACICAVSIGASFQNADIPFMLLHLTLRKPDSDLSSVPPVIQMQLTGVALLILGVFCKTEQMQKFMASGRNKYRVTSRYGGRDCRRKELMAAADGSTSVVEIFMKRESGRRDGGSDDITYIANEPLTSDIRNDARTVVEEC